MKRLYIDNDIRKLNQLNLFRWKSKTQKKLMQFYGW
jgi:hypothetical protein